MQGLMRTVASVLLGSSMGGSDQHLARASPMHALLEGWQHLGLLQHAFASHAAHLHRPLHACCFCQVHMLPMDGTGSVDVIVRVSTRPGACQALAQCEPPPWLQQSAPAWARLQRLCARVLQEAMHALRPMC